MTAVGLAAARRPAIPMPATPAIRMPAILMPAILGILMLAAPFPAAGASPPGSSALPTPPTCDPVPARAAATAAASTPDSFKHEVACRIHARNRAQLYEGAPPPVLRSIVVLSLRIDASGRLVRVAVLRSNGIRDLERRAIRSVRAAAPLPLPTGRVLRGGSADMVETWLFRDDGRFQVRSLAMVQAQSAD